MSERPGITPRSPSGEVLPPPNPCRTHGRTGRATVTAGTLSTVGDNVAGEDVKRYVKGRDADRDDADVMHGESVRKETAREMAARGCRFSEINAAFPAPPWQGDEHLIALTPEGEAAVKAEALRQGRLRRWQAIR